MDLARASSPMESANRSNCCNSDESTAPTVKRDAHCFPVSMTRDGNGRVILSVGSSVSWVQERRVRSANAWTIAWHIDGARYREKSEYPRRVRAESDGNGVRGS